MNTSVFRTKVRKPVAKKALVKKSTPVPKNKFDTKERGLALARYFDVVAEPTACCAVQEVNGISDTYLQCLPVEYTLAAMLEVYHYNSGEQMQFGPNAYPADSCPCGIPGFFIFTEVVGGQPSKSKITSAKRVLKSAFVEPTENYGERLADYITAQNLGTVTASAINRNPNSGNDVRVFVWAVDKHALTDWWKSTGRFFAID